MFGFAGRSDGVPCESHCFGMKHMVYLVQLEKAGSLVGWGNGQVLAREPARELFSLRPSGACRNDATAREWATPSARRRAVRE